MPQINNVLKISLSFCWQSTENNFEKKNQQEMKVRGMIQKF